MKVLYNLCKIVNLLISASELHLNTYKIIICLHKNKIVLQIIKNKQKFIDVNNFP